MLNVIEISILKSCIFPSLLNATWRQLLLTNSSSEKLGWAWLTIPVSSGELIKEGVALADRNPKFIPARSKRVAAQNS